MRHCADRLESPGRCWYNLRCQVHIGAIVAVLAAEVDGSDEMVEHNLLGKCLARK